MIYSYIDFMLCICYFICLFLLSLCWCFIFYRLYASCLFFFLCVEYYFSFELPIYVIVLLYYCSPVCILFFWFPFEFMLCHTFFYSLFLLMMSVFFIVFILNSKCISCFIDVSFDCSLIFDWLYFCGYIGYMLSSRFV